MYVSFHWPIFKNLLHLKLKLFREKIWGHVIDYYIWVGCTTIVTGYVFQTFGTSASFGPFQFVGSIASIGLFDVFSHVAAQLMDFDGDQTIAYYLTLPTSALTIFLAIVGYYVVTSVVMTLFLLPLGKILLWRYLSIAAISWVPFFLIMLVANIFYGALTLWLAACVSSFENIEGLWSRYIFPMWYLGGFQFSWAMVHNIAPALSYAMLVNPIIYIIEGMRASMLGQQGYFNVWLCIAMVSGFSILCFMDAFRRLKKRLDFV